MATNYPDDLTNINEPKTPREMFQKIMRMIETDQAERADDRDTLLEFIDEFKCSQKLQDDKFDKHIKDYNDIVSPSLVRVGTFIKIVTWVGTTLGGGVLLLILAILTGQVQIIRP